MTSHAEAAAAAAPVVLGGKTYYITPLTDRTLAEIDEWLRGRIIQAVTRNLPADTPEATRVAMCDAAVAKAASVTYAAGLGRAMIATPDGMTYLAYRLLAPKHPELTLDAVAELLKGEAISHEIDHMLNEAQRLTFGDRSRKKKAERARRRQRQQRRRR